MGICYAMVPCHSCRGSYRVAQAETMPPPAVRQLPALSSLGPEMTTPRLEKEHGGWQKPSREREPPQDSFASEHHVTRWPPDNYGPALDWDISQMVANLPPEVRSTFVKRVYLILAVQMHLSALVALPLVLFVDGRWLKEHALLYYLASFGWMALLAGSACCCQETLRAYPANCSFLLAFAVLTGICIGLVCVMHSLPGVAISAGSSAVILLGLAGYASVSGSDFKGLGPYLFAACFGLLLLGLVLLFVTWGAGQRTYGGISAVLFCFLAICGTQRLLGGTHGYRFNVDDYVFAALSLYLDAFNVHAFLLDLLRPRGGHQPGAPPY